MCWPCAKQAGKRSGFGCRKEKTFVDFKEKFRSLDFFVSFFHQGKNEKQVIGVLTPKRITNKIQGYRSLSDHWRTGKP